MAGQQLTTPYVLPPREIARRLERPVDTVRTHLERGLARLRAKLDGEFGDRESWCVALLPFLPEGVSFAASGATLTWLGGLLMSWKLLVPLAISILAVVFWNVRAGELDADGSRAAGLPVSPGGGLPEVARSSDPGPTRDPAARAAASPARAESASDTASHLHAGRVLDLEGRPLAGMQLEFVDPAWARRTGDVERFGTARTAADGAFELSLAAAEVHTRAADVGWRILAAGDRTLAGGETERVHIAATVADVSGRVVAADSGLPLPGARLEISFRAEALPSFPFRLQDASDVSWMGIADEQGEFELERVARFETGLLRASAEGYRGDSIWLTELDAGEAVLRLERVAPDEFHELSGVVLDSSGVPAAGVPVTFGQHLVPSGEDGRFSMRFRSLGRGNVLIARRRGSAPAIMKGLGAELREHPEVGRDLVLRLGPEPWSVAGRVVDGEGEPLEGVLIELLDGLQDGTSNLYVEDVLAQRGMAGLVSDRDGRFSLGGLFADRYTIRARMPENFFSVVSSATRGSSELSLVLDEARLLPVVSGVVVDRHGQVVADAGVGLTANTLRCADGSWCMTKSIELGRTDARGRFELSGVAHEHVELSVTGEGIESASFELDPERATELELLVELRLRFRLGETLPEGAESMEVRDAAGVPLKFVAMLPHVNSYMTHLPLGGKFASATVEVLDTASELAFLRGEEVLARRPLELRRGETVVVE